MPRPKNPVPTYRLHKQSGQAVVTVRGADGRRRDVLLGRHGSPESRAEYERVLAEVRLAQTDPAARASADGPGGRRPTVNELLLAFLTHADAFYRYPDGSPTREPVGFREALRPLRELYGHTPAGEFGPLALKAYRQKLVDAGLCRPVVNKRVSRVKQCFKWAASEELVSASVYEALRTVAGLTAGRTTAREPEPVKPVAVEVVLATLPRLSRQAAGLVRLQMLTGMRPGEVCRFRLADVDTSGPVWSYTPGRHKTAHHGKARRIKVGPQAQAVVREFAGGDPALPLFSPRQAREDRYAAMRTARRSKVQPSQRDRSKPRPLKLPGAATPPAPTPRRRGGPGSSTGTRTSSGTRSPPRSESSTGWRPPRCCSGTRRPTSPRCTPSGTTPWPSGWPQQSAEGRCLP